MLLFILVFQTLTSITNAQTEAYCGNMAIPVPSASTPWNIPLGSPPMNLQCEWILTADLGKKVQLNLKATGFTAENTCGTNQIDIFNGPNDKGTSLGQICNNSAIDPFTSDGYQMYVKYTVQNAGKFEGSYMQVDGITPSQHDAAVCGEEVINTAQANETWTVPINGQQAQNKQCRWRLYADDGKRVQVTFNEITFSSTDSCTTNKLDLYNGSNDTGTRISTICKLGNNNTYLSDGNAMFVKFTALDVQAGTGFKAAYMQVNNAQNKGTFQTFVAASFLLIYYIR